MENLAYSWNTVCESDNDVAAHLARQFAVLRAPVRAAENLVFTYTFMELCSCAESLKLRPSRWAPRNS